MRYGWKRWFRWSEAHFIAKSILAAVAGRLLHPSPALAPVAFNGRKEQIRLQPMSKNRSEIRP